MPVKKPKTQKYQMWVDLYELVGSDILDEGDECWIKFSIGNKVSGDQHFKWKKKKSRFCFKNI